MRSLIALPAGGILVLVGALFTAPETGTAARLRGAAYYAQAQAPTNEPVIVKRTINLTEEDRHTIREIVLKDSKVAADTSAAKVEIGDQPPGSVVTYEFPALATGKIAALKSHRYFIKDDAVVIVDGNGGKVADIVKEK
jgi:hypothetical protein